MFVESPVVLFLVTYGPVGELRLALVFFVLVQFYRRGFIRRRVHRIFLSSRDVLDLARLAPSDKH